MSVTGEAQMIPVLLLHSMGRLCKSDEVTKKLVFASQTSHNGLHDVMPQLLWFSMQPLPGMYAPECDGERAAAERCGW